MEVLRIRDGVLCQDRLQLQPASLLRTIIISSYIVLCRLELSRIITGKGKSSHVWLGRYSWGEGTGGLADGADLPSNHGTTVCAWLDRVSE